MSTAEKTNSMLTDDLTRLSSAQSQISESDLTMNPSLTLAGLTDASGTNGDIFIVDTSLYLKYSGVWRQIRCDVISYVPVEVSAGAMVFTTSGADFNAIIQVTGGADVLWTFDDGATSTALNPTKSYGTSATRHNSLTVTPWSALTSINIGYDAADGGDPALDLLPQTYATDVSGLSEVASSLQYYLGNYNPVTSLDFSDFTALDTIECYSCSALDSINLANTPSLRRLCVEMCHLSTLDISASPLLEDIRGAAQGASGLTNIIFGETNNVWHLCIRDNPNLTNQIDLSQFPNLEELNLWNCNQTGEFNTSGTHPRSIVVYGNAYTSANFDGLYADGYSGSIAINNNSLTSINISNCPGIASFNASYNNLDQAAIDGILQTFTTYNGSGYTIDLTHNTAPSETGMGYVDFLVADGWVVNVDTPSGDIISPVVTSFVLRLSDSSSLTVDISTFTATDASGVTGYLVTEASGTPLLSNPAWAGTAQTEFTFSIEGSKTLYGWARDAGGNISDSLSDTINITLPAEIGTWEDTFNRADQAIDNNWLADNSATGEISTNRLHRTDNAAYRSLYNSTDVTLPADYAVTFTVPEVTVNALFWGVMGRYAAGNAVTLFWPSVDRTSFVATPYGFGATPIDVTVTGGFPASWSQSQNHTIKLAFVGTTVTISFDSQEYGYFTSSINNTTGTAIGIQGDGQGVSGPFYLDNVLVEY